MNDLTNHHSVVFLLDAQPPTRVLMLKRAAWKALAPNLWTGIGGKYQAGDTIQSGAERELREETDLDVTIHEFARVLVNKEGRALHYFWGVLDSIHAPTCTEGELHWIKRREILDRTIIGTTRHLLVEWFRRDLNTDVTFTLHLQRPDVDDPESPTTVTEIRKGL